MKKFELFDVQYNTGLLVQACEAGEPFIVMKRKGDALFVAIPMSHKLVSSVSIRVAFALRLHGDGLLTLRRACHLSGLPLPEFIALVNEV